MITLTETLEGQKDLGRLCADRSLKTKEIFGPNAFYGFDFIIKKYAGLPKDYPLKIVVPHGVRLGDNMWEPEIKAPLPVTFTYDKRWKTIYQQTCRTYGIKKLVCLSASPFLYLADLLKNQPQPKREGTIFFPAHSTHHIVAKSNFEAIADALSKIDDKYKPVTVCVYWKDFNMGHHLPFQNKGMKIVSAGHMYDPYFLFRFYHLCSMHSYSASNALGSHLFYSFQCGCSFFLWDEFGYKSISDNKHLNNKAKIPNERRDALKDLFRYSTNPSKQQQKEAVDYYLGAEHFKSKLSMKLFILLVEIMYKSKGRARAFKRILKKVRV